MSGSVLAWSNIRRVGDRVHGTVAIDDEQVCVDLSSKPDAIIDSQGVTDADGDLALEAGAPVDMVSELDAGAARHPPQREPRREGRGGTAGLKGSIWTNVVLGSSLSPRRVRNPGRRARSLRIAPTSARAWPRGGLLRQRLRQVSGPAVAAGQGRGRGQGGARVRP